MAWNGWLRAPRRGSGSSTRSTPRSAAARRGSTPSSRPPTSTRLLGFFLVSFFVAVAAGLPLIRDAERNVGALLHSTPLRPSGVRVGEVPGGAGERASAAVPPACRSRTASLRPSPARPGAAPTSTDASAPRLLPAAGARLAAAGRRAGWAAPVFALGRFTGQADRHLPAARSSCSCSSTSSSGTGLPPARPRSVLRGPPPARSRPGSAGSRRAGSRRPRVRFLFRTRPSPSTRPSCGAGPGWLLPGLLLVDLSRRHLRGACAGRRKAPASRRHPDGREPPPALQFPHVSSFAGG